MDSLTGYGQADQLRTAWPVTDSLTSYGQPDQLRTASPVTDSLASYGQSGQLRTAWPVTDSLWPVMARCKLLVGCLWIVMAMWWYERVFVESSDCISLSSSIFILIISISISITPAEKKSLTSFDPNLTTRTWIERRTSRWYTCCSKPFITLLSHYIIKK